jgi:protocatechuate 3,4-dioxygenase beta subunit
VAATAGSLPPGALEVTVEDSCSEQAIPGARVTVLDAAGVRRSAFTDALGLARFPEVAPGEVEITASADGRLSRTIERWVAPAVRGRQTVGLHRPRPLRGRVVREATGVPVPGATVAVHLATVGLWTGGGYPTEWVLGPVAETLETDADGRFVATVVSGRDDWKEPVVVVEAPGCRTVGRHLCRAYSDEPEPEFTIRIVAGGSVRGVVRDARGRPVSGADVRARHHVGSCATSLFFEEPAGAQYDVWPEAETTTDEAGRYRLDGLGLGETFRLEATADGWKTAVLEKAARPSSSRPEVRVDIAFARTSPPSRPPSPPARQMPRPSRARYGDAVLAGIVVDERGAPVRYGHVGLPDHHRHGRTDGNGRFRLNAVPRGPTEIVAGSEHHASARSTVVAPSEGVRLVAARCKGVWVTIRLPQGAASIPRAVSRVCGGWSTAYTWPAGDRARELVCRTNPGPGRFLLRVAGFLPVERRFTARETGVIDLGEILLDAGLGLRVRVRDEGGRPLAGARVVVRQSAAGTGSFAGTGPDGTVSFTGLARGPVHASVDAVGHVGAEIDHEIRRRGDLVTLTVRRGVLLRAVAIDAEGHHRPRLRATVRSVSGDLDRTEWTDSAGCAEWRLPAGAYDVEVKDRAGRRTDVGKTTVRLESGQETVRVVVPVRDER